MEAKILTTLNHCVQQNEPVALITVISSTGSSPGKPGAMMTVQADRSCTGTIGGGNLEFKAINEAILCLQSGENKEVSFILRPGGELGMTCGGELRVFIRVFQPQPQLLIVGAGHIGIELHHLAMHQGFCVSVIDDRPELLTEQRFPGAQLVVTGDLGEWLREWSCTPKSYITIATKSHDTDRLALEAVIHSNAAYIGMIGSRNKIRLALNYLLEQGVPREKVEAVYAPMGLDIASVLPKEIAMSIMSEILLVKNRGSLQHMKNIKGISSN